MKEVREKIRSEFKACRTQYEVYMINLGLKQVYPEWLVTEERNKRILEFTFDKIFKNRG